MEGIAVSVENWHYVLDWWCLFQIHIRSHLYLSEAEPSASLFGAEFQTGVKQPE